MSKEMNSPNTNRIWSAEQLAEGAKLAALFAAGGIAAANKAGYHADSVGQFFKAGQLIPSPPKPAASGVGVVPFALSR